MTVFRRDLPRRAWRNIYRVTAIMLAFSVAMSVILTNLLMETFSAGINLQGLAVSIVMPMALGGPMIFVFMLKHEQLRTANLRLEKMATTDYLTQCLNRGAFTRAVTSQLARLGGGNAHGAMLIVDADDFKNVNDRYGHHNGDDALRLIAQTISNAIGDKDLVGRLGGEEFGVFLGDADAAAADQLAEQIRADIAAIQFQPDDEPCPLSVSIGGATFIRKAEFANLYRLADQHLYHAKNNGRDRVAMMQAA